MEGPKITGVEGSNNNELLEDFIKSIDWVELALELQFPLSGPQCIPCAVTISPPRDPLAQALMEGSDSFWSWKDGTKGIENCEEWKIDLRKLNVGAPFEAGNCGKLFGGRYKGEDVAIKILERPQICGERNLNIEQRAYVASKILERAQLMEQQVQQEVMMLASLKHPNIVGFIGACLKPKVWCIVTEYTEEGGSIRQQNGGSVPLKLAVKQALDVARGMEYAHGLGFTHGDLNSHNLLIFKDKSIKIAGFGVARIKEQTPEKGAYRWMAPEMIQHRACTNKVDVYSFGIVLWELVTGSLPFHNIEASDVVDNGVRPIIPNDCLPSLSEIMTRCWDSDPEVRPPFTQVVRMLGIAETDISVHNPRFQWCFTQPRTTD